MNEADNETGFAFRVALELESSVGSGWQVNIASLEQAIVASLNRFFGQMGAAATFSLSDCESYAKNITTFVVSCRDKKEAELIRAALTLQNEYQKRSCAFHLLQTSDSKESLADAEVLVKQELLHSSCP